MQLIYSKCYIEVNSGHISNFHAIYASPYYTWQPMLFKSPCDLLEAELNTTKTMKLNILFKEMQSYVIYRPIHPEGNTMHYNHA